MEFFKREVNEGGGKDNKLVGAVVSTNIFYYLNLFCVVDKRSKSSILRPLIEDWAEEAQKEVSEKELILLAAKMGYKSYKNRRKKQPFALIIKQQAKELVKKGVSKKHEILILQKIRQLHESQKDKK